MTATSSKTTLARRHRVPADFAAAQRVLEDKGWTDGLPVVPPTEALVCEMLGTQYDAKEILGIMEPGNGTVTIEKIAANAVMAGCRPEFFPVVVAATKALLQPQFYVGSTACTTGGAAPVLIVSGSLAEKLKINSGTACFGGNVKANATIGRAVRLTMRNLGGAQPEGGMEKSTLAWPGKISMCFAENESRSPWGPFRLDRGYSMDVTTVSAIAARGIYAITESAQETGTGVLETLAASMRMIGAPIYYQRDVPVLVCLGPEHANEIAKAGYSKQAVREYLFEHCRLRVGALRGRGYHAPGCWSSILDENDDDALVPIVSTPDYLWIVVAGGDGRHSAWIPAWNVCEGATEPVDTSF